LSGRNTYDLLIFKVLQNSPMMKLVNPLTEDGAVHKWRHVRTTVLVMYSLIMEEVGQKIAKCSKYNILQVGFTLFCFSTSKQIIDVLLGFLN